MEQIDGKDGPADHVVAARMGPNKLVNDPNDNHRGQLTRIDRLSTGSAGVENTTLTYYGSGENYQPYQILHGGPARNGGGDALGRARAIFGGTVFAHTDWIGESLVPGRHHVRGAVVYLLSGFDVGSVVHELGHVLDNRLGFEIPVGAALFGGGPADNMSRLLGADPTQCPFNRSACGGYSTLSEELAQGVYARSGPSEDFAEAFRLSVLDPANLPPIRAEFVSNLAASLTTTQSEFVNPSFYYNRRIVPLAAPAAMSPPYTGTPVP